MHILEGCLEMGHFWRNSWHVHGIWKKNTKVPEHIYSISEHTFFYLNIYFTCAYTLPEHISYLNIYFPWTYILPEHIFYLNIYLTWTYILPEHPNIYSNWHIFYLGKYFIWILSLRNKIYTPEQYFWKILHSILLYECTISEQNKEMMPRCMIKLYGPCLSLAGLFSLAWLVFWVIRRTGNKRYSHADWKSTDK